jgi:nucleoside-diphosphate-sugar epimerase
MRVLVTGHNGYIGAIMLRVLRANGHEVVGQDTFYFEECTLGEEEEESVPSIRKDVRDLTVEDLEGFDAVVHLAALSNDPLGEVNTDWTYGINHLASVNLAKLAKEAGVRRFLYSSSCSLYGTAGGDEILDENAPFKPLTPYAISKVRSEAGISKLADSGFSPVSLRNATAYGVSPRLRADVVLNNLVCWAHCTGKICIMSDGTPWRPIVHIEDIANAFAAALVAPKEKIHNQAFNVGVNGENYQVRELAEIVRETVVGSEVEYAEGGGPDPRSYRVDFSKLHRALPDFKSKWNARRGAEELYTTFRKVGLALDDFQGQRYIRVKHLSHLLDSGTLDNTLRWKK